jgi:hypothetical protein
LLSPPRDVFAVQALGYFLYTNWPICVCSSRIVVGAPTYAYYNDPFTPGPLRRNEVIFDVTTP